MTLAAQRSANGQHDDATRRIDRTCLRRVLHVINGDDYSGAERVQDLLAMRLPEFGYDVRFVCLKPGRFATTRMSQHVRLDNVPMRGKFDLRPVLRVAQMARESGCTLIHSHSPRTLLIARPAALLAGLPLVHHVQSPAIDSTNAWRNRVNFLVARACLTGVKNVIAVSKSMKRYLRCQIVSEQQIQVIPNAVPARGPLPVRPHPTDPWNIGICAMFRPRKGIEVLLGALAQLRQHDIQFRLRAVGYFQDPEYERYIKRRVVHLGLDELVDWRGFRKNVYDELSQMDLFVLPSLFGEGLPLAILEAMSAGVPAVSTDVEGTPEAVRNGVDGLIVEPGNAEALATAMKRIICHEVDWQSLRSSAHRRQNELYSDTKMAADVARMYDRMLPPRPVAESATWLARSTEAFQVRQAGGQQSNSKRGV